MPKKEPERHGKESESIRKHKVKKTKKDEIAVTDKNLDKTNEKQQKRRDLGVKKRSAQRAGKEFKIRLKPIFVQVYRCFV